MLVTAEMDCLAEEGAEMARRLAGREGGWREDWEDWEDVERGVKYICRMVLRTFGLAMGENGG